MINQELPDSKVEQEVLEQKNFDMLASEEVSSVEMQDEVIESHVDVEKQNEEQIKNVLLGLLEEESIFDKSLEGSNLLELTLLMEVISGHENIKLNSTRVGILKRTFDEKYQQELSTIKNEYESDPENAKKHKQIFETYSNRFTVALAKFNKRKNEYEKELEAEKTLNYQKKKELLDKLIQIVKEDRFEAIDEVRNIQSEWKKIGHVIIDDNDNLLNKYKAYLDNFYDSRARFKELLEQDHQTHLKEKLSLIESIISLIPSDEHLKEKDGVFWREASEKVKIYQEEWKIIGNVPIDQKELVNNKFKEAVDNFYAQRKKYYEIIDSQRLINSKLKLDLLDKLKPFSEFVSDDIQQWYKKTEELKELQGKWKAIGPAPSNEDSQLWNTFREYCKTFYSNKSKFFANLDAEREKILKQKLELCEKAEEIANGNEFKKNIDLIKDLQKKWKEIDTLSHVDYYKVLRRFRKACDNFFKKRNEIFTNQKKIEEENLEIKKAIISRILELVSEENLSDSLTEVKELQEKWKNTGIVPYKYKENLNKEFRDACDLFYQKLKSTPKNFSTKTYSTKNKKYNSSNKDAGNHKTNEDIKKIRNKIARLEEEIEQYETNIQFFANSKAADKIKKEYTEKIEMAKAQKKELENKLKAIYSKNEEEKTTPSENPKDDNN